MENATTVYRCPNCNAGLCFDAEKQLFDCAFCLSEFSEQELLKTDSRERAAAEETAGEEFCSHMQEYFCPSCGGEVVADETTAADFCLYCQSPVVLRGRLSGQMRPHKLIPFRIDRDEAERQFLAFAKKKWFIPRGVFARGQMEKIRGVYYPFWVADADTDCELDAKATRVRSWTRGDVRYTETSYFDIRRRGNIHFEDMTFSALREEDKQMLEGVLPYPSSALTEFSMPYLSGFLAKKRNIEREELAEEVRGKMNSYAGSLLSGTAVGYTTLRTQRCAVRVLSSRWEYALMPVWVFTYTGKKRSYTYAMNGYTGKIYGELPVSGGRLAAFASILFGVAAAGAALLYALIGGGLL